MILVKIGTGALVESSVYAVFLLQAELQKNCDK